MKNFMLLFLYPKKLTHVIVFFLLHIGLQAQEICNNGIDDDGDGYVDQYDSDCFTVPTPVCFAPAPSPNFQIELAMQGPENTLDVSISPTIGDLDGDGIPEIIAPLGDSRTGYTTYHVVNGVLENAGINFTLPLTQPYNGTVVQPAIADIDRDGKAEVITVGANGYVYVFAHTGGSATNYKFISNTSTNIVYGSPRIADIDEDGVPEVIVGSHVFKFDLAAQTLTLAVRIPTHLPFGRDGANWGADIVVVDILPSNPGKEIVAGSVVYGVDLVNGTYSILKNLNTINSAVPLNTDGPTAVADLDLDGDLDIVFDNGTNVYVWDPVEDALLLNIVSAGGNARRSMPTISYVYDEVANLGMSLDYPEILIGNRNVIRAFNLQIPGNIVWTLPTTDSSGQTGITSFDFNGDGIQELIYNDETQIRIINGNVNPPVNLATFNSGTETWMEHPVVADVDDDNQAEMIAFTGNLKAGSGQGRINIFKSVEGVIWQPARKVWNQRGYRVVNINDDLTVPAQETKISNFMPANSTSYRVLNQYNAQLNPNTLLLEPGTVAATDVQLNSIKSFNLATGELTLDLSVLGGTDLPAGTPITIYNGDPTTTAAPIVGTGHTPTTITSGTTQTVMVTITSTQSYTLYAIVNDNGSIPAPFNLATDFPSTGLVECDYTNNIARLLPPIFDTDGDGINDVEDLDADNDGILDVDESHGYDIFGDADGDGILNFQDVSQGPGPGDGSKTDYTDANGDGIADVFDTDGDGIIDAFDLDSDNDGCPDSNEYYGDPNADGGDGGQFGPGPDPVATNIDGTVSHPAATYIGLLAPVYTAVSISLNTAMPDRSANIGDDITFTADASAIKTTDFITDPDTTINDTTELTYQWYVSTDGGTSFTMLTGETNSTLTVTNVQLANDKYIYQVILSHPETSTGCTVIMDDAILSITNPIIALVKTASIGGTGALGDDITYTFTVTNMGNVTLTGVVIDDALTGSIDLAVTPSTLAPGEEGTATASYTITQADIEAGNVSNTATVMGTAPDNSTVTDTSGTALDNDDSTDTTIVQSPAIALVKTSEYKGDPLQAELGDLITFSFTVHNTGNINIDNIIVDDPLLGGNINGPLSGDTNSNSILEPTEIWVYEADYNITQIQVDNGVVENQATVNGTGSNGDPVNDISGTSVINDDKTITILPPFSGISLVKIATFNDENGDGYPQEGETIGYSFTVKNIGYQTLTNIMVTDTKAMVAGDPIASLDPDATDTSTFTASYTITQMDIDAGAFQNTATVTGKDPANDDVSDISGTAANNNDPTITILTERPSLEATKTASITDNGDGQLGVDDVITYTITVQNTGNVTLDNVALVDTMQDATGNPLVLTTGPTFTGSDQGSSAGNLLVGEIATYTATYQITQSDVDAGGVMNSVLATGDSPAGTRVSDISDNGNDADGNTEDDTTDTTIVQNPAIALVKTASIGGTGALGDVITYTFTVTNTGDVTLTGVIIDDALTGSVGLTVSPYTLAPGEVGTATASYAITQLDIEAGNVSNTATVTGTAPNSTVTDTSGTALDNDDSTDTPIAQNPAIALVKTASIGGTGTLGDVITYTFTVTNTGDVTLTGVIIDDALTGSIDLPVTPSTLARGEVGTATATYTITQNDLNVGYVVNTATAIGTAPDSGTVMDTSGTALDNDDPTSTPLSGFPELILWKKGAYEDTNNDGIVNLGDRILFNFTVENTGTVDMMNITVTDPLVTVNGGPILVLETGATDSTTFTAQYVLTQEDIDTGAVYNIAMAEGEDTNGKKVTVYSQDPTPLDPNDPDYNPNCADCTVTVLDQQSGIALIKQATFNDQNNDGDAQIGETITYYFTIINTGNVMLTNIMVQDPLPGIVMSGGPISLAAGATDNTTFTGQYVITSSDLTAGKVSNQATVSGLDPKGTLITDVSDNQDEFGNSPTVIEIEGCTLQVHNALSPNNDGMNDVLTIKGIECYPDNTIQIYNRWGVLVFEVDGYNNRTNVFQGFSDGRTTIARKEALPSGTYFYVLHINKTDGTTTTKKGYLNINR